MIPFRLTAFMLAVAGLAAAVVVHPAGAEDEIGKQEYMNSCASCHGESGKGDGPLAELMTVEVPDLTTIKARNDGDFPFQQIFMVVDGRSGVRGHGYPMPVWGARYRAEAGDAYGPYGAEEVVRGRVLSLVYYLQAIQADTD